MQKDQFIFFKIKLLVLITMTFASCIPDKVSPTTSSADIYLAGNHGGKGVYWKNGTEIQLSPSASVLWIDFSGQDFYAFGGNADGYILWKNGEVTNPPLPQKYAPIPSNPQPDSILYPQGFCVAGQDVYILAYRNNSRYPFQHWSYWKNGTLVATLSTPDRTPVNWDTTKVASAIAIGVLGTDVYVNGNVLGGAYSSYTFFWKNGVVNYLPEGQFELGSFATDFKIIGNDIYLCGKLNAQPTVWKNGYATPWQLNANFVQVLNSMAILNGDVYTAGYTWWYQNSTDPSSGHFTRATYWKNGEPLPLTNVQSEAHKIAVSNKDVFILGSILNKKGNIVWKNGFLIHPFDGSDSTIVVSDLKVH